MRLRLGLPILLAVAVCATLAATALPVTTRGIKIGDNYFVRSKGVPVVTVAANTRVTWHWTGNADHDVSVLSGPVKFHSKIQSSGTYSKVMKRRGTYKLYCEVHGAADQSMILRVR